MKENITQIILIIVSILIVFGIDRAYESYKAGKRKQLFIKDQISQLGEEDETLSRAIESAINLKSLSEKGLQLDENADAVIKYIRCCKC